MRIKENEKIKVAVLYGGRSAEHEVSLASAASIIKNLDKNKFEVVPVLIDKKGQWWINKSLLFLPETPDPSKKLSFENLVERCDVVFPVLHGTFGEDGTIQGLLELIGLPYVGANVLGSAIGMDKNISKRLVSANGVNVVPFITFNSGQWKGEKAYYKKRIKDELGYPLFVKPVHAGSSLGITKVKEESALLSAIQLAFEYDTEILIEKALEVQEIEISVLEDLDFAKEPLVSVAGEIIPRLTFHEFYSYEAKYIDEEGAKLVIPANIDEDHSIELKKFGRRIFRCLACEGMARIDFFIEKHTHKIYFNEINTIPGFTKISMYPKLWEASGCSYQHLLTHLIDLAFIRDRRLSQRKRITNL